MYRLKIYEPFLTKALQHKNKNIKKNTLINEVLDSISYVMNNPKLLDLDESDKKVVIQDVELISNEFYFNTNKIVISVSDFEKSFTIIFKTNELELKVQDVKLIIKILS